MFFLPIRKRRCFMFYETNLGVNKNIYKKDIKKPFFQITEDSGTAKSFIDAIIHDRVYDARNYLSKVFVSDTDWRKVFKDAYYYKQLTSVSNKNFSGYKVNSVMVMNKENKKKEIIHFYMVKEPDDFSSYKIIKITKEGQ
ncbi:MAG: hypothetical protein IJ736_15080 [Firmicutes bacterium]|nr:hypothetical protein [Bacillota bacterium]